MSTVMDRTVSIKQNITYLHKYLDLYFILISEIIQNVNAPGTWTILVTM